MISPFLMSKKFSRLLLSCLLAVSFFTGINLFADEFRIKLGIDVVRDSDFDSLDGKKIGLVIHPASVDSELVSTLERFRSTDRCKLVALYGPEHGVYGDEYAGVDVPNRKDPQTGLPIFSLYGKTRKPTPEMLKGIDALVFDLQDIGSRSYTYISTMKACLEACAENGVEFVILDRPNPLGGERVEGPKVEKNFESFVSALNIPYVHGMTMGELALFTRDQFFPHYEKLKVIKMEGWKRDFVWEDTHLRWIPTSPHIPNASVCPAYAATGILGELDQVSVGVGYPQPFELVGAPWIKAESLADALSRYWQNARKAYEALGNGQNNQIDSSPSPKGIRFQSARFKPFYGAFKDTACQGVQIFIDPKTSSDLVELNFRILDALGAPKLFSQAKPNEISMFDKVCGSDEPRKWLMEQKNLDALFDKWKDSCDQFRDLRKKYLLY
jgi:uncharacterized protein YbbC (DUF1343 family)